MSPELLLLYTIFVTLSNEFYFGPVQRSGGVGSVPPTSPLLVPDVGYWPIQPCSEEGKSGVEGVRLN